MLITFILKIEPNGVIGLEDFHAQMNDSAVAREVESYRFTCKSLSQEKRMKTAQINSCVYDQSFEKA